MSLLDDLISYWKMDEASGDALDAHSTNDLTDTNTVAAGTGIINGGRDFEVGNSEYFNLADNAALSVGNIDFTFTAWVKLESKVADSSIVGKGGENDLPYNLDWGTTADRFRFRVSSATGFTNLTTATANNLGSPSLATWYFIVAWHDATANTINIQVNNGTADSAAYSAGSYDDTGAFRIGSFPFYNNYFDGLIDEVGFWKRILTTDEKTDLYNSGAGLSYDDFGGAAATRPVKMAGAWSGFAGNSGGFAA